MAEGGGSSVLAYYLLGFFDLLGQSTALRELKRLPRTEEEAAEAITLLKRTAGTVRSVRKMFLDTFASADPPSEFALSLPSPNRERVIAATRANLAHWGVSDSVIVAASLLDIGHPCTPVNGVYRTFIAAAATWLATLSVGRPMRGGLEVGLAVPIEGDEVYGPVLDHAYHLESRVAGAPRIVVGKVCLDYLDSLADGPALTSDEGLAAKMAARCRSMICPGADGVPMLDALGDEMLGLSNTMGRIFGESIADRIDPAHQYVRLQLMHAEGTGDEKMIPRYRGLLAYFDERAPVWRLRGRPR
jgi:hypothetical protein